MPGAEPDVTLAVTIDPPRTSGSVGAPGIALIAHGAGSSAEFVRRAFGRPLRAAGWRLASYDLRGHGASTPVSDERQLDVRHHAADLAVLARALDAQLLGGVSMGAHAAVLAATGSAERGPIAPAAAGLLLTLPAWTGEPDVVAAANAVQAAELAELGVEPVLHRICRDHPGWVADELAQAWPGHRPESFVAVLRALARSPGPAPEQLCRLRVPVGVVALRDDPMHPAAVARRWAGLIPGAVLAEVDFAAPTADRSVLGAAAITAWRRSGMGLSASR